MTERTRLRAVKAGEKTPAAPAKRAQRKAPAARTVEQASKRSRREGLVALRDRLGKAIDDPRTHPRDLANLARQQIAIAKDIEAIDAAAGGKGKAGGKSAVATTADEQWNEEAI